MKNKLLSLLLVLAMLLSLAACVGSSEQEDPTQSTAATGQPEATQPTDTEPTESAQQTDPQVDETLYALKVGAGTAAIDLEPSIFPTEGFSGEVHDDPHVRILLLEAGEKAAIVSCELVNTPEEVITGIITQIAEKPECRRGISGYIPPMRSLSTPA